MTHTTVAGEQIPNGPDAFNPPTQFNAWADHAALWHNHIVVALDSDRTALAAPELRNGIRCYVVATDVEWLYKAGAWTNGLQHAEWTFSRIAFPDGASTAFNSTAIGAGTNDSAFATVVVTGNTITFTTAGIYAIDIAAILSASSTGPMSIVTVVSGALVGETYSPSGTNGMSLSMSNFRAAAGTVMSLTITKTTGGNADITATIKVTKLSSF